MNKKLQIMISIFILLIMFGIQVSYAIAGSNDNNIFFTVSSEEISPKETLKISFNLNKIEYDNFKIVLNSNVDASEIYTDDNVTLKEESDAVVIEIDKTKMNLENIEMSYVVPEEIEINSNIKLFAKVIIEEETESQDDEGNIIKQEKTVLEESNDIIVIENNENKDNINNTNTDNEKQGQNVDTGKEQNNKSMVNTEKSNNNNSNKSTGSQNNKSSANNGRIKNNSTKSSNTVTKSTNSSQSSKNVETATYKGSSNNYLNKLQVKGIELNTNFNKENSTYFIKVTDTSNLKITATAEDSTAKVVITGNDSIKEGTNKILIAVTAENGNTRYYRIFVECEISD